MSGNLTSDWLGNNRKRSVEAFNSWILRSRKFRNSEQYEDMEHHNLKFVFIEIRIKANTFEKIGVSETYSDDHWGHLDVLEDGKFPSIYFLILQQILIKSLLIISSAVSHFSQLINTFFFDIRKWKVLIIFLPRISFLKIELWIWRKFVSSE